MTITVAPSVLLQGARAEFMQALESMGSMGLVSRLATLVKSTAASQTYSWLGEIPQLQEFVTERKIVGMSDTSYTLVNKTYEATVGVRKEDLDDDQIGAFQVRIRQLAESAVAFDDSLISDVIIAGTSALCYDGVSFFNDAHPIRGKQTAAQDNIVAQTGTSVAQFQADFQSAVGVMRRFKDEANRPFHRGALNLAVMVPPELEYIARTALEAPLVGSTSNVYTKQAEVMVNPYLTDAGDWYLFNIGTVGRPFLFQEREPTSFESQENESESGFFRRAYYYGVTNRRAAGYMFWQNAVKIA